MCGIFCLHGEPGSVAREHLVAGMDLMRHRGPDDEGLWIDPEMATGIGHRRLSIVDIEGGAQPVSTAGGLVVAAFNGEIYNYRGLRAELVSAGHRFRTASDAEVVAYAIQEWGEGAFQRLDGMFAIVAWLRESRSLLVATDPTGKKPIYYTVDAGRRQCMISSALLPIIRALRGSLDIEPRLIVRYLALSHVPAPDTVYRGVKKLGPGSCMVVRNGVAGMPRRYWEYPSSSDSAEVGEEEAAREVRRLVTEAVRKRLESEVPLGAFLSGGLDSSVIVGTMAALTGERVRTFSVSFPGENFFDESAYADLVADHFRADHTKLEVHHQGAQTINDVVRSYAEPNGDSSAIPTYLMCELAREHVVVALSGDGGDETFGGYDRMLAAQLAEKLPRWATTLGSTCYRFLPRPRNYYSRGSRARRFLEQCRQPLHYRLPRWVGPIRPEELRELVRPEYSELCRDEWLYAGYASSHAAAGGSKDVVSTILKMNLENYLFNDLHPKVDRMSMAHGLEVRSPLLDKQLVDYVAGLPGRFKLGGRSSKVIFRRAFSDFLPRSVVRRPKRGFGVPLASWFRGDLHDYLVDSLLSAGSLCHEYCRPETIEKWIRSNTRGLDLSAPLYTLLVLELWLRFARDEGVALN